MMTADGRRYFLEGTEYENFDTRMRKTSGLGETQSDEQDSKDHNRKIVHIFGCPNSGKTTLRKALADKHPDYPDYCIDDFRRRYGDGSFEGEIDAQIRFGEAMMHGGFFECSGAGRFARYHLSVCRYRPQYIVVLDAPVDICISRIVEGKYLGIPFPFTDDDEHLIRTVSDYLSSERFARIREGIPTLWLDAGNPLDVQIEEVERFTGLALPEKHRWDRERG